MNDKHGKIEYPTEPEASTYQTGSTKPPKSYTSVILVLLGLVIFLGGIVTALGFTNLRLFRALTAQSETTPNAIDFSNGDHPVVAGNARQTGLGFSGETVSEFWHTYHQLPLGIFIQSVDADSDAARQGVLPGDILVRVNGTPVASIEELHVLLENTELSQPIPIVLHRGDSEVTLTLHVAPAIE